MREKVLVAMSGGVDSAVAAALLVEAGYDVTGVFLCLQTDRVSGGNNRSCCSPQDAADARAIASRLGIPFKALSVAEDFAAIIDSFVEDYENGRTPNPCIRCNERVKFGRLFKLADSLGAHRVATGHYARIAERNGVPVIAPAQAGGKDQSYVLFRLPREWLGRILFPVGDLESKQAVREIAGGLGLEVHDKPDSQDVCFVPDGNYTSLLEARGSRALRPGDIVDSSGRVVGKHDGYGRFTIGQRRGTGVAMGHPAYVVGIDPVNAVVTLGPREELLSHGLVAHGANWQVEVPASFEAMVKIRYNHRGAPATVTRTGDDTFEVRFRDLIEAVTPGQAAVAYADGCLLGGGWIERSLKCDS
ncbi:MAG TPA: tRNA 2-thiouridine(34) synthase MnmA [Sedimentisphaerales bacterium]|nr:tRNA 2-thiouridine(34) synthase MnmA [Sedimentisphaerales bacterium]HQG48567.1 tRNA 2-thiouridine(34) synthase MnmA [Sedimentisphaerales bacterium]HQI27550.1 tRNA 2-thiouridine(34) synthase MnmA [Sedimentisphaerales bacterium]